MKGNTENKQGQDLKGASKCPKRMKESQLAIMGKQIKNTHLPLWLKLIWLTMPSFGEDLDQWRLIYCQWSVNEDTCFGEQCGIVY